MFLTPETGGEEERGGAAEPAEVREVRGHGGPDLPDGRHRAAQPAAALPVLVHLHVLGPLLRGRQPLQAPARLHHADGPLLPRQEEERGAAPLVPRLGQRLLVHGPRQGEPVHADHVSFFGLAFLAASAFFCFLTEYCEVPNYTFDVSVYDIDIN